MNIRSLFLSLAMTAALAACGGSSGDDLSTASTPQQAAASTTAGAANDEQGRQNQSGKAVPLQALKWAVTDLGTLPDTERSVANDINNVGQIVGYAFSEAAFRQRPFVYQNGGMAPMLSPQQDRSINPLLINDNGQIAGYTFFPQALDPGRAFLYSDGTLATMGNAGGANGLNDDGKLVGNQTTWTLDQGRPTDVRRSAYLYYQGVLTDLTAELGVASANGINNQGDIVGGTAVFQAYVYRNRQIITLGALPGDAFSRAIAINDDGLIVGDSFSEEDPGLYSLSELNFNQPSTVASRAFLYAHGTLLDLNALGRFTASRAWAINAAGQVLGEAWVGQKRFSFLYQNGRFINLTDLKELKAAGWSNVFLRGMNDLGQLVGSGTINGTERALLLTSSLPGRRQ